MCDIKVFGIKVWPPGTDTLLSFSVIRTIWMAVSSLAHLWVKGSDLYNITLRIRGAILVLITWLVLMVFDRRMKLSGLISLWRQRSSLTLSLTLVLFSLLSFIFAVSLFYLPAPFYCLSLFVCFPSTALSVCAWGLCSLWTKCSRHDEDEDINLPG